MSTLGYTTHAATGFQGGVGCVACKFTPSENGTITSLTTWVKDYFGGGFNLRFAVYSDNAGTPNARLAQNAAPVAVSASDTEYSDTVSLAITSGVPYWLAVFGDSVNANLAHDAGTTHQSSQGTEGTTPPATWTEAFSQDWVVTVFATYTPAGAGFTVIGRSVLDDD